MHFIHHLGLKSGRCLLLFCLTLTNAIACPCFNNVFLESTFRKVQGTHCVVFTSNGDLYRAEISGGNYTAYSTHSQCLLHTEHHDVNMNFGSSDLTIQNVEHHHECMNAIISACKNLPVPTENRGN